MEINSDLIKVRQIHERRYDMKALRVILGCVLVIGLMSSVGVCAEKTYTLRYNTVAGPEQPQTLAMNKFAEVLEELSGGKITVKVFHSGQLGDQKTSILNVKRGSLDMYDGGGGSWFADLLNYPEVGVLSTPYLYRDLDHMYRVLTGPVGGEFADYIAKNHNIRILDWWYLGTRQLDLKKKVGVVRRPEDLKGVKLRMPNVESWLNMGRALGADPTPLGFGEVYMALKTGTIDGQDNPLPTDYAQKFVEVTHYIVLTDHFINPVAEIINEKLWQEMPENYRMYVRKAMEVARYWQNEYVLENEAKLLGLFVKDYGMEIIIPDKQAFMENVKKFYTQPKFNEQWGEGTYEKIQSSP